MGIMCLTLTLLTLFQLYHGGQFYLCSNKMYINWKKNITLWNQFQNQITKS